MKQKQKKKKYFITSNIKCRKARDKHFGRKRKKEKPLVQIFRCST